MHLLILLFLTSTPAVAQITGEVRGTLTDPAGAAVAQAKVTLSNSETGETRIFKTDPEGRYAFPLLKVGDYQITVEAPGFRRLAASATVRSAEVTVVNLKLELGQVTEQLTVTDAASPLDMQSAQRQESFAGKEVQDIPVVRDPNAIALLLPGIVPAPASFNSGSFISNGNRARANNITIDNITATDISTAGTGSTNNGPLNFSSLKEVKVITNNFSAEFGRNSGAQVQYITRSGANQLHGEVYEYFQNSALNARDWFDRSGSPSVNRFNEFGGVLGGPVIRNKTHFFLSAEVVPVRGLGDTRIASVPAAAMIAKVTDPTSKKLLEKYKLPAPETETAAGGTVSQSAPNAADFHQYSVRIDHQLSARDSLYARFGTAGLDATAPSITFVGTNLNNFGLNSTNSVYSANLNETHVFSSTVISEFRAGFGRTTPVFGLLTDVPIGPRINFANGEVSNFGQADNAPQGRIQNTWQAGDTVTWTKGAHNVKMGGDYYRYQLNSFFDSQARGTYTFLNWDDFAGGRPSAFSQRFGSTFRGHRTWLAGAFLQDDYRVTPHLTLNLGFRMEMYGPVKEVNNLVSNLDLNCRDSLGAAGSGPLGCFTAGGSAIHANVYPQPRIGFAYNPRGGKLVIRGGYGLVSDFNYLNPITSQRSLPPFNSAASLNGAASFTGANSWASLVAGTAAVQQQARTMVGVIRNDVLNYGNIVPVLDPNLKNPQVHQWSFGMERELPRHFVLKAAYVGTKGNFLQRLRPLNLNANRPAAAASFNDETSRAAEFRASYAALSGTATRSSGRKDPRFNSVNYYDNSANSNYHALEVSASRPFRGGLSLHVAYTWAKSIDDVSDALTAIPNDSTQLQNPYNARDNRGVSGFDLPHRLVVAHVWELPWGKTLSNRVLARALSGWGMSGVSTWRAGFPVSFEAGPRLGVPNISVVDTAGFIRPNASGAFAFHPFPAGSPAVIAGYASILGLSQPLLGNFGTLGRNTHRLNGLSNFDWNVYKTMPITERIALRLRCEIYNVFNQHSFLTVDRNISSPSFGQYNSLAQSQRAFQLGGVIQF
ncbi:MAG: TonB-dependent receptor [Bryobacterales bacterium]|nr:TonB-dependent receptor [Bryobacterales bacterium]